MGNTNDVVSLDDARDKKQTEHELFLKELFGNHRKRKDVLEHLKCFSKYTPNMELGDVDRMDEYGGVYLGDTLVLRGSTMVMLELPTYVVKNAINICEEVNAKYTEEYGEDEEWGLTPFDVLQSAYDETNLMHYPEDVVEKEIEKKYMLGLGNEET